MNRRQSQRYARRVQVAFWKQGDAGRSFSGYTTNMSVSGMFVSTNTPLGRGNRLRIEVLDPERGFLVEGVVTHAVKTPQQLQAVRLSGMGVRLLKVEELIANFLDGGIRHQHAMTTQSAMSAVASVSTARAQERQPPAPASPEPMPVAPVAPAPQVPVYPIYFTASEQFLVTYRREMQNGGLFVPAGAPAQPKARVLVELHFPGETMAPLRLPALVAQSYAPELNRGVGGMAVEFEDQDTACGKLEGIFSILRNGV